MISCCVTCQNKVEIEAGERRWLREKGMTDPRHCIRCRKARKSMREQQQAAGHRAPHLRDLELREA
jgi:hypothetical protein